MAGRPFLNEIAQKIEQLGGDDWVFDQIADGVPMRRIAEQLGCSRPLLYQWRDLEPHREGRQRRWKEARALSAIGTLEDGAEILDDLAEEGVVTPAQVTLANSRANYRMAMAKIADPSLDPKKADVEVNLSVGELHLDALRKHGGGRRGPEQVEDAEVLAIEGED